MLLLALACSPPVHVPPPPVQPTAAICIDDPASPAARAGLQTGDTVLTVDGQEVGTWPALSAALTGTHTLHVQHLDRSEVDLKLEPAPYTPPYAIGDRVQDAYGLLHARRCVASRVQQGPADRMGIEDADHLVALDGETIPSFDALAHMLPPMVDPTITPPPVELTWVRSGQVMKGRAELQSRRYVDYEAHKPVYVYTLGLTAWPKTAD